MLSQYLELDLKLLKSKRLPKGKSGRCNQVTRNKLSCRPMEKLLILPTFRKTASKVTSVLRVFKASANINLLTLSWEAIF